MQRCFIRGTILIGRKPFIERRESGSKTIKTVWDLSDDKYSVIIPSEHLVGKSYPSEETIRYI